jgi:hypothetical protein
VCRYALAVNELLHAVEALRCAPFERREAVMAQLYPAEVG